MNAKSLLIAAAVLATPACAVSEAQVTAAADEAVTARVDLIGETYLSRDTFSVKQYLELPSGEQVEKTIQVRYRLRFVPAGVQTTEKVYGDYDYDGQGTMEYEAFVDQIPVNKPELSSSRDASYYVKRTDGNSFRLFDCDSTSRCSDQRSNSKLTTFTQDGRKVVKLSGLDHGSFDTTGLYLEGVTTDILFDPSTAAPESASLAKTLACSSNGYTMTLTPNATSQSVALKLRDDHTGVVLHESRYFNYIKDVLGHYFATSSWQGVRIALGDASAVYENDATGLALDFPKGSCKSAE